MRASEAFIVLKPSRQAATTMGLSEQKVLASQIVSAVYTYDDGPNGFIVLDTTHALAEETLLKQAKEIK